MAGFHPAVNHDIRTVVTRGRHAPEEGILFADEQGTFRPGNLDLSIQGIRNPVNLAIDDQGSPADVPDKSLHTGNQLGSNRN